MTTTQTCSIKIHFEGDSRDVDLPAPPTLAGLQAAVASTFSVDLAPRSSVEEARKESDLSFTCKDPDGDSIAFDKDSELSLALRLCGGSLEIFAARADNKGQVPVDKADPEGSLYKIAARNLREYHGVPSMAPDKLTQTLALLKLSPRRLVQQGLAPRKLLGRMKAVHDEKAKQQPLGHETSEDLEDGVEVLAMEDEKKQWNDGFAAVDQPAAAVCDGAMPASSHDEHDDAGEAPGAVKKNLLHKAFVDGGVQLRPREVRPLLLALAVKPCRLARLGLVDAKDLRAMLHAERKKANKRNGGRGRGGGDGIGKPGPQHPPHPRHHLHHPRMARGGPGGPPHNHGPSGPIHRGVTGPAPPAPGLMVRGGGGRRGPLGPGAGGKMMRRHHAHPPPPPPPQVGVAEEGMHGAPGRAIHRRGRRSVHPHSYVMEEGEGGPGPHDGPPPGMRVMRMRMRRARSAGGGGGQQVQHGHQNWG
ncbi:unnamed protein product [Scytosiphon promiscuus]